MSSHNSKNGWLVVVIVGLAIGAYCLLRPHPPTRAELAGEWSCTNRPWTISFEENGQIAMSTIGPARLGEYELDSQGSLRVMMLDGSRFAATLSMNAFQLTVTDADGASSSFQRIRS